MVVSDVLTSIKREQRWLCESFHVDLLSYGSVNLHESDLEALIVIVLLFWNEFKYSSGQRARQPYIIVITVP
jgi:hypothetical protein